MPHQVGSFTNFPVRMMIVLGLILSIQIPSLDAQNPCRSRDSVALVAFAQSISDTGWDFNTPISTWEGIVLNNEGCVRRIVLSSKNLSGTIPPEIGTFSELERLTLTGNNITGSIPPEIGNLSSLIGLYLTSNNLEGPIPLEIGHLSEFQTFEGGFNNLSGQLPSGLANIKSSVQLQYNNFSGCWPSTFISLCDKNVNFSNNPQLPDGGDLTNFCSNSSDLCPPSCTDGILNNGEAQVDCGGPNCSPCPSCDDGILNQDEIEVDCGGIFCPPCAHCFNGIQDGDETGLDCGGLACAPCGADPLELWLYSNQNIAANIDWNFTLYNNDILSYFDWNQEYKDRLFSKYDSLVNGYYPTFPDPLPNLNTTKNNGLTALEPDFAFSVYISFVANSLYQEIQNNYNWSIIDYDDQFLQELLSHESYFEPWLDADISNEKFVRIKETVISTPSPPAYLQNEFICPRNILQSTQQVTFSEIMRFARDSMFHFVGSQTYNEHWQYLGFPPMSRVIDGTTHPIYGFGHWTYGCHGTVTFSKWLGFMLNIPILDKFIGSGHRIALLPTADSIFISHGDDPYGKDHIEPRHFNINKFHFTEFFGDGEINQDLNVNVGRRVREIHLNNLSQRAKNIYCQDYATNGNVGIDNILYDEYDEYSSEFLNAIHFWDRLHIDLNNSNLAQFGNCFDGNNIPIDYTEYPINWEHLENGQSNPDNSVYKTYKSEPMYGKSSNCLSADNWIETVIYNSQPKTWIGLADGKVTNLNEMDYAIKIEDNVISVIEKGVVKQILSDDMKLSVNFLKINITDNGIQYFLNGFQKFESLADQTDKTYSVYFGAEEYDSEINDIYTSTDDDNNCCPYSELVSNTGASNQIRSDIYNDVAIIESDGTVGERKEVRFYSGSEVDMKEGFSVSHNTTFLVDLFDCKEMTELVDDNTEITTHGTPPDSPFGEEYFEIIDNDYNTKFLNFNKVLNFDLNLQSQRILKHWRSPQRMTRKKETQ